MRWFPHSVSSSTPSPSPSSSSSLKNLKSSPSPSASSSSTSSDITKKNTRGAWLFGAGRRSTRSRKLRHVVTENDTSVYEAVAAAAPLSRSPSTRSYFRSITTSSVAPQPLPLPELPSPSQHRQRDIADCRLPSPSPRDTAAASSRSQEYDAPLEPINIVTTGFRMRSVFASKSTRTNSDHVETRTPGSGLVHQDTSGCASTTASTRGNNYFSISVPARSTLSSPFASPTISPTNTNLDDFVPYHYISPKGTQFWSAPEMLTTEGHPSPAFFDLSALGTDNNTTSPHPRSPRQQHFTSPLPRLSLDALTARRESITPITVHPLPLPPWAGTALPSPSATFSQPVVRPESLLSMKSQWQKGKLIGRGTFGSVYVATNRETGALCAMKEAEMFSDDPKSAECIKQLEQEIQVLSQLKHPNIVQYYGSEIVEDKFYIYLEYVHPGSINKYVRDHCGAITESVVRNFTRHILSGLAYLHSKKTIHRDIKGANLLVDSAGVVKLADFGMAKHLTGHSADLSLKGSPYWMAPELMQVVMQKDNSCDLAFAIDIWSLGCTIIEMFTGKPPWSEYEGAAAMFKVMKDTPPIPETLSPEGKDFLRLCFIRNPAERPTASMLLEHRFLRNIQQPDISSSSQLHSGTTMMDSYSPWQDSHSPGGLSENPSAQIAKGKSTAESTTLPFSYS